MPRSPRSTASLPDAGYQRLSNLVGASADGDHRRAARSGRAESRALAQDRVPKRLSLISIGIPSGEPEPAASPRALGLKKVGARRRCCSRA